MASNHLHPDEFLDLYHRTTPDAARQIQATGRIESKENPPRAYFSTKKDGQAAGYGDAVVHVRVPRRLAELDDEFPDGEQHYAVNVKHIRREHIVRPEGNDE